MRSAKVVSISHHDRYSDYAMNDQERFARTAPRPGFAINWREAFVKVSYIAAFSAAAWFLVWAAAGGWRTFHHFIDWIMAVIGG